MAIKYHQSPDGRLLNCVATKRSCPYAEHYTQVEHDRIVGNYPSGEKQVAAWFRFKHGKEAVAFVGPAAVRGWGRDLEYIVTLTTLQQELAAGKSYCPPKSTPKLLQQLRKLHGNPKVGTQRAVFDRGDGWVIKVPLDRDGQRQNRFEAAEFVKQTTPVRMYECRLEVISRVQVLVAEKLHIPTDREYAALDLPWWVSIVDAEQVGLNRAGEVVCYDY